MKNRTRKRLIDRRNKLQSRFVKGTLRALAEAKAGKLTAYQYSPLTDEESAWESMAPVGREFGSPDYERLTRLDDQLHQQIEESMLADDDDGAAAKEHLAAGRPITYRDPHFPDAIMRKWPNGHRELIDVNDNGNVTVLRTI